MRSVMTLLLFCLLIVTGCTEVKDTVQQELTIQQVVEQISKVVDKRNQFQSKVEESPEVTKYKELTAQFDHHAQMESVDAHQIEQIMTVSAQIQKTLEASRVTLYELDAQTKEMKSTLTGKLSSEDHQAVQKTLDHLILLVHAELVYTDILIKRYQTLDQFYRNTNKKGKESSQKTMTEIEVDLREAEKKLDQQVDVFNESWNTIHKHVRGTNLEEVPLE